MSISIPIIHLHQYYFLVFCIFFCHILFRRAKTKTMAMLSLSCGTYVTPDAEARDAERVPELLPRQRSLVLELEAVAEQNVASPEPVVVHAPLLLARQRSLGLQADAPVNAALGPEADAAVACAQSSKKRKRSCRTGTDDADDADEVVSPFFRARVCLPLCREHRVFLFFLVRVLYHRTSKSKA